MKLPRSLIKKFHNPRMPVPDLWIPPKIDIDNLPSIDDPETALRAIRKAQDFMIIHEGAKDGDPFTLVSWMWLAEWQLNGLLNPDGTRRIREMFILIPKKNAKSPYLAWKAIQLAGFDNEPNAKIACVSSSVDQARYMFQPIEYAVDNHPLLSQRFKRFRSENKIEYYGPTKDGDFRLQGSIFKRTGDPTGKQGGNWHGVLFDESSEMLGEKGWNLWRTYTRGAQRSRRQPIKITCTTGNVYQEGSLYQMQREKAFDAIKNPGKYPRYLPIVYAPTAIEEKDLRDKIFPSAELVARVNPGADEVFPLSALMEELSEAFNSKDTTEWDDILRFMFNVDISALLAWMKSHIWNACDFGEIDIEKIIKLDSELPKKERPEWYIGIDLAPSQDLTAWVAIRAPRKKGEKVIIYARAYLPQDRIERHAGIKDKEKDKDGKDKPVRKDAARYIEWEKAGWLTTVPGKVNDDAAVISDISAFIKLLEENGGDLQGIAIDPAHSKRVMTYFIDQGYENWVNQYKNTFDNSSEPCGDLMNHAIEELISHGGNPALSWCVLNLVMVRSQNDEIKPVKNRAADRIDIAIALILAWQCWFRCRDSDYL